MSGVVSSASRPFALQSVKRIRALLPDSGIDRRLIRALRDEKGVNAVESTAVRAVSMLHEASTQKGRLPESELARLVTVIVAPEQADAVFDFMFASADMDRPGGGILLMDRLLGTHPFLLPDGVPDEQG